MNFEGFPQIPQNLKEEAEAVIGIFEKLKGNENLETIEVPSNKDDVEEYIRKLEIMKKGTIIEFPAEETAHIHERIDAYIEKLKEVK